MLVESVVDVFGDELSAGDDYTVLYFTDADNNGTIATNDPVTDGTTQKTINGEDGAYPTVEGGYFIVVVKGAAPASVSTYDDIDDETANRVQSFRIASSSNLFEGAFAFEVAEDEEGTAIADREDFSDTAFKYDGSPMNVGFAVDGKQLNPTSDYTVSWSVTNNNIAPTFTGATNTAYAVTNAATYTATIYGKAGTKYADSYAKVEFTVDPVDLSADVISLDTVAAAKGYTTKSPSRSVLSGGQIKANGVALADGVTATATKFESSTGAITWQPQSGSSSLKFYNTGIYTFEVADANTTTSGPESYNVVGGPVEVTGCVVESEVVFYYGTPASGTDVDNVLKGETFTLSNGESFNPSLLKARVTNENGAVADFTYAVTKDGQKVESYDEPGEYVLTLDSAVTAGFKTAGHKVVTFKVEASPVPTYTVFAAIDGTALSGTHTYTGQPIVPSVAVFDQDGKKAVEGEDYTVSYKDVDTDEAVESVVDAGTYKIVVTFADARVEANEANTFTVSAAKFAVAKADKDVYAYTGEAVVPTFTANTKADWSGASASLSSENAKVTYKKSLKTDADGATNWEGTANTDYEVVAAKDLKEEGTYQATVEAPASMPNFAGAKATAVFEISKTAGFSDVDAGAWYADSVYKAAELEYMEGIAQGIFAPENAMTRAEFAQLVFNMAGGERIYDATFPTKFSDVPADAWYAQAVEWAARYGIVNGTSETTFEPNGTVTREQIATMLYRYAGNNAQADASALDAFVDGAQVSDWAVPAMAWAVEEGYMNGKGANDLQPQATATRAEIATLAVRVQPEAL
jgi:hypothetical protein